MNAFSLSRWGARRRWRNDVLLRLDRIEQLLQQSIREEKAMATSLGDLSKQVSQEGDVISSAVTLLTGLKQQLDAAIASGDPAQVQAISDAVGAQTQQLAQAVAQNTPAVPATPAAPSA